MVKRSVSFDARVWGDLEKEVGSGPVSPLVNDALTLYLRRQRGLAAVAAYEAEHGELTGAELAAADALLDDAGVADLRIAEAPAKPRKRPAAKKASGSRRPRG